MVASGGSGRHRRRDGATDRVVFSALAMAGRHAALREAGLVRADRTGSTVTDHLDDTVLQEA